MHNASSTNPTASCIYTRPPDKLALVGSHTRKDFHYSHNAPATHKEVWMGLGLNLWKEAHRLKTFKLWPTTQAPLLHFELAYTGMFYCGKGHSTQCIGCNLLFHNWVMEHNPMTEHRMRSPDCPFARLRLFCTPNEPLTERRRTNKTEQFYRKLILHGVLPLTAYARMERAYEPQEPPLHQRILDCPYEVDHPEFNSYHERRKSFMRHWPQHFLAKPHDMAAAGYFFRPSLNKTHASVECFYCSEIILNWNEFANPWIEQARSAPGCHYIIHLKGHEYVNRMLRIYGPRIRHTQELDYSYFSDRSQTKHAPKCCVCLTKDTNIIFEPCSHAAACDSCAERLPKCPACRQPVLKKRRVFII